MCGIAGFLDVSAGYSLEQAVGVMADTLYHRGPDDRGMWADESAGIAFGHRRLSVLDLSPAGHQPMLSAGERYVIAFNGEIYNHTELRAQLQAAAIAPVWRGHSDTETVLACLQAWGIEKTLTSAVGMFAIALWDRELRTLILARDRVGEKPLYYGWQGDTFLFGSELKALKAHPAFRGDIDRGALALLLRHNYVPAPWSIYQGIHKLPAGTFLQISLERRDANPVPYWSLAEVAERRAGNPFAGSDAEALEELELHLGAAVRGQMVADVPLGALLSGGIDSTAIAALMQSQSTKPVRTFTIGFGEREYDEASHARAVAAHLGTDHTELRLNGGDALALVPQMPAMYDEPFADCSQLPTHLVMKLARQHVTVALSGDAGDEIFGGYNRYIHVPRVWDRFGWMPQLLRSSLGVCLKTLPGDMIDRLAGPLAKRFGIVQPGDKAHKLGHRLHDMRGIDDLYVSLLSEWSNADGMVLDEQMPPNLLDDRARWPNLADPVARMMALDGLTYLPDDILVKVDRAAMAVSLETRVPFLDRDVIEFAWSLPMHMKIRDGQGKWLLRQLLDRYVPRALVDRPKMGFGIPLDAWLRGPLRDWAENLLAEDRLRLEGYLNPVPVRAAWKAHLAGQASYGYRLWSVLMFQAWLEQQ
ncbi:MAG: asparagine synthase (glutamine-hydrolyzing) [Pseudomonadales bacterium]|nr:asparagine synthase (glutamine-hydrolyzing) [Halioglobus sp.]MCP5122936.1 asparagine synthase (glutamine-hydrolyzing) [Pseudomonadales bacterium]